MSYDRIYNYPPPSAYFDGPPPISPLRPEPLKKKLIFLEFDEFQALLNALRPHYQLDILSVCSTAFLKDRSTGFGHPAIIIIVSATSVPFESQEIVQVLRDYASNLGTVLFGGVPWGFDCEPNVVCDHLFGLSWIVGVETHLTQEMVERDRIFPEGDYFLDDKFDFRGTFLIGVPAEARVYFCGIDRHGRGRTKGKAMCCRFSAVP
ncbi:hypothetical protein MMC28_004801 [Mycoblastus sanguinarius]|nr:hypothetical protein [Mycoblastus sanguinarius]